MKGFSFPLFVLIVVLTIHCGDSKKTAPGQNTVPETQEPVFDCFTHADTAKNPYIKACHNTVYKLINNKYVLAISYDTPRRYDSCLHLVIDTFSTFQPVKLFVFKEGESNIIAYCNDYGRTGPVQTLTKASGDLYIRFSPADTARDSAPHNFRLSVWINKLVFTDSATKDGIFISKELIYDVPNWTWFAG